MFEKENEYCKECDLFNKRNGTNYPDHHDLMSACPWRKKRANKAGPTELDLAMEKIRLDYPELTGSRKP